MDELKIRDMAVQMMELGGEPQVYVSREGVQRFGVEVSKLQLGEGIGEIEIVRDPECPPGVAYIYSRQDWERERGRERCTW